MLSCNANNVYGTEFYDMPCPTPRSLPCRLTVGRGPLEPTIEVRILAGQPFIPDYEELTSQ
jgi:hypothetical protein